MRRKGHFKTIAIGSKFSKLHSLLRDSDDYVKTLKIKVKLILSCRKTHAVSYSSTSYCPVFVVVVFFCQKIQRKGYQFSSKYKLDNLHVFAGSASAQKFLKQITPDFDGMSHSH